MKKLITIIVVVLIIIIAGILYKSFKKSPGLKKENIGIKVDIHRAPSSVWTVATSDLTSDGTLEYILGTMDNRIVVQSMDGKILWTHQLGGLPFSIQCADLDGNGSTEVIVSSFDEIGTLHAFDNQGKQIWTYSTGEALMGLEISDLNNDGEKEILTGGLGTPLICLNFIGKEIWQGNWTEGISIIRVGDIDNDGNKEIIIAQPKNSILAFKQDGKKLWKWDVNPSYPLFSWTSEIIIEDMNGDGVNEIITGTRPSCRTTTLNGNGEVIWQQNDLVSSPIIPECATPMMEVGDFAPSQGKEVLVMTFDQMLYLFDVSGKKLMTKRLPFPLMSITSLDRNSNRILTGTGIRETQFYTFTINSDNIDQLDFLRSEHPAKSNLENIRTQVSKFPTLSLGDTRNSQPYVVVYKSQEPGRAFRYNIPLIYNLLKKRHNSENLRFEMEFLSWEEGIGKQDLGFLNPTLMKSEELIEVGSFCEDNDVPFWFQIWHGSTPFFSMKTVEGILKAAPNMCRGFMFSETFPEDSEAKKLLLEYSENVMRLCKTYGEKKVIFHNNKSRFFDRVLVDPDYFRVFGKKDYHNVFIPMLKPNNSPETDIAVAGSVGMWRSDFINDWGYSSQIGNWRWPGIEREHLLPWDVLMRTELIAASLGAKYFRIERPEMYLNEQRDENDRITNISVYEDQVMERDLFYTLLEKGIIQQAGVEEHLSLSSVVFHEYDDLKNSEDSITDGLFAEGFGPQIVSPAYAPGYIYRTSGEPNRYANGITKANPLGVMTIIPGSASLENLPGASKSWRTDGTNVENNNKVGSAINAREAILKSFESAVESLPFRAENIWLSAVQWDKDLYVLYAIDPGYFEAWGSNDYIQSDLSWDSFTVTDRITGDNLEVQNQRFNVIIPAGAFRILEVRRAK